MVADVGMKLILLIYFGIFGLTAGKFIHSNWDWNEANGVDVFLV
jgi:hypothetical protein